MPCFAFLSFALRCFALFTLPTPLPLPLLLASNCQTQTKTNAKHKTQRDTQNAKCETQTVARNTQNTQRQTADANCKAQNANFRTRIAKRETRNAQHKIQHAKRHTHTHTHMNHCTRTPARALHSMPCTPKTSAGWRGRLGAASYTLLHTRAEKPNLAEELYSERG